MLGLERRGHASSSVLKRPCWTCCERCANARFRIIFSMPTCAPQMVSHGVHHGSVLWTYILEWRAVADHTAPSHLFDGLVVGKQLIAVVLLILGRFSAVNCVQNHEYVGHCDGNIWHGFAYKLQSHLQSHARYRPAPAVPYAPHPSCPDRHLKLVQP